MKVALFALPDRGSDCPSSSTNTQGLLEIRIVAHKSDTHATPGVKPSVGGREQWGQHTVNTQH